MALLDKLKSVSKPKVEITISNQTIARIFLWIIGVSMFVRFIGRMTHVLTLIGVSLFLALALNPAVTWIARHLKSKSRTLATGVAYLTVLVIVSGLLTLVVPSLVKQTTDFVQDLPNTVNSFQTQDSGLARTVRRYNIDEKLSNLSTDLSNRVGDFSGPVLSTAGRIGNALISLVTVLVLTFMILIEGPIWLDRAVSIVAEAERKRLRNVLRKMYKVITGYVNGQVFIAAIASLFAAIALYVGSTVTDVSLNPIALAGIVFIMGLIPLIGNTLAAAVVVLVCLFSSAPLAIGMAIYFLIYQQVENATLQPYIQARSNQLTPLIVFVAALVGASVGGLLGALGAIPVAGCLRILFDEYVSDRLPTRETVEELRP